MPGMSHLRMALLVASCLSALKTSPVAAADLSGFAAICARDGLWFQAQPKGSRGTAIQYAEHVKDETITALSHEHALIVLQAAAGAARSTARHELKKLLPTNSAGDADRISAWCRDFVSDFILRFMHDHDTNHQELLRKIEQAKR
jgi:hypothetical protein